MSTQPYTTEEKIAARRALLEDLDRKVTELGRLPTQKEIEADPNMKSNGGYIQIFHGIRNAWDVWLQLKAGKLCDADLVGEIRNFSHTDPEAYEISQPLAGYAETLNSTIDEINQQYAGLDAEQYKITVQDASIIYMGRLYYRNHRNANIIIRMTELLQRAMGAHIGGQERKSLVAWARDCGFAMKHPGTYYPYDPEL